MREKKIKGMEEVIFIIKIIKIKLKEELNITQERNVKAKLLHLFF